MTGFPGSPRLLKGGIAQVDSGSGQILRIVVLQYNPDTLTRSFQIKSVAEGGDRSEALRLTGPPVETIKLDAEIDATDQLELPDEHPVAVQFGIAPQLAALETIVYPTSDQLNTNNDLAQFGTLEIAPMEAPLSVFVWSRSRIVPVRLTELSVTEEAFDPALNPIRAKVSLGMRVLSVDDLGFKHKGGSLFMAYLRRKERFATMSPGDRGQLGIPGVT
jgi:hypothetical protein